MPNPGYSIRESGILIPKPTANTVPLGQGDYFTWGQIVNAYIAAATIDPSKIANLTNNYVVRANGSGVVGSGLITTDNITALNITTALIADLNVTTGKIAANAITQTGVASISGATTSTTLTRVDSSAAGKVTLTTVGGDLIAIFTGQIAHSVGTAVQQVAVQLDSGADSGSLTPYATSAHTAGFYQCFCAVARLTGVSAASHDIWARHCQPSGTGTSTTSGSLIVLELKK